MVQAKKGCGLEIELQDKMIQNTNRIERIGRWGCEAASCPWQTFPRLCHIVIWSAPLLPSVTGDSEILRLSARSEDTTIQNLTTASITKDPESVSYHVRQCHMSQHPDETELNVEVSFLWEKSDFHCEGRKSILTQLAQMRFLLSTPAPSHHFVIW